MRFKELSGKRFGMLIALERKGVNAFGRSLWFCQCDCGNTKIIASHCLISGDTKSCGCLHKESTRQMAFGRGIKVCDKWLGEHGFENFLEDVGKCPDGLSLDRKDVYGNYEPGNCRWSTAKVQKDNQRSTALEFLKQRGLYEEYLRVRS